MRPAFEQQLPHLLLQFLCGLAHNDPAFDIEHLLGLRFGLRYSTDNDALDLLLHFS
jgi:hypothetical protein